MLRQMQNLTDKQKQVAYPLAVAAAALGSFMMIKAIRGRGKVPVQDSREPSPAFSKRGGSSSPRGSSQAAMAHLTIEDVQDLSPEELTEILVALHVSKDGVAAIANADIDGAILLHLQDDHLAEIGVKKLGDQIRIKEFVARFANAPNDEDSGNERDDEDEEDEVVGGARGAETAAPATNPDADKESVEVVKIVVEKLRALYELFGSEDFLKAEIPKQKEVVALAKQDMAQIDAVIDALPEAIRSNVAPLSANLREVVEKVGAALDAVPDEEVPAPSTTGDGNDLPTAAQLAQMLKHFHSVLESDDMANAPQAQRVEALASIVDQLKQVARLAMVISEDQRKPLLNLCQSLIALAEGMADPSSASPQRTSTSQQREEQPTVQHASLEFITKRYRALFDALRQESVIKAAPEARQAMIVNFKKELASLKKECEHLPTQQRDATVTIAAHVEQVIVQLEKITNTQLGIEPEETLSPLQEEQQPPTPVARDHLPAASDDQKPEDKLRVITESLSQIVGVVKSPQFVNADPAARGPICQALGKQLNSTVKAIATLPENEREAISPMATQVVGLVQALVSQSHEAEAAAKEEKPQTQQPRQKSSSAGSPEFKGIVETLRSMFTMLKSDKFKAAEYQAKFEISIQLMQELQKIIPAIQELSSQDEQAAAAKLATSLMDLLKNIAKNSQTALEAELAEAEANQSGAAVQTEQDDETAQNEEAPEDDEDADPQAVVNKLTQLFSLLQSPAFTDATGARQAALGRAILEELVQLKEQVEGFDDQARGAILPLIARLGDAVDGFVGAQQKLEKEEVGQEDEEPEEEGDMSEEIAEEEAMRKSVFGKAKRISQLLNSGVITRIDDLKDAISMMDDIDRLGIRSQEEIDIRQGFHAALMKTMQDIEKKSTEAIEEAEGVEVTDESGNISLSSALQKFIQQFTVVNRELNGTTFQSKEELYPFLTVVDELINAAEEHGLEWKASGVAVNAVGDVLTRLQTLQDELPSAGDTAGASSSASGENTIGGVLLRAVDDLKEANIDDPEKLLPFIQLLEHAAKMEDSLTIDDLRALQVLQETVIEIGGFLQNEGKSKNENPEAGRKSASPSKKPAELDPIAAQSPKGTPSHSSSSQQTPLSPQSVAALRVPPNTPIVAPDTSDKGSPQNIPSQSLMEVLDDAEDDETEETNNGNEQADDATILRMLTQLAVKLGEENFISVDQIEPFDMILDRVKQGDCSDRVAQAVTACETIILKKKEELASGDNTERVLAAKREMMMKIISILTHERFNTLPQNNKLQTISEARHLIKELTDEQSIALDTFVVQILSALKSVESRSAEEDVAGSLISDMSLIPRISERLLMDDFCQNTTLFELRCIDMILERLMQNPQTQNEKQLREMVATARAQFSKRMGENDDKPMKDPTTVAVPLVFTGQSTEDDKERKVIRSLLFSEEEEEEFTVNEHHLKQYEQKPMPVAEPSEEMTNRWLNDSIAVFITIPTYGNESEDEIVEDPLQNETILSETCILHTILESNYGFDATSITKKVTAQDLKAVLAQIAERKPARLILYLQTPQSRQLNGQHALALTDGTVVPYTKILEDIGLNNFGHGVVIHDSVKTFEVVSATDGKISPLYGVSVSDGAYTVSNCSRCWLFDGLFTPIVAEFLLTTSDTDTDALCVEDLVNRCISVLSTRDLESGSFTGDTALAAPFLLPLEIDEDEEEEEDE